MIPVLDLDALPNDILSGAVASPDRLSSVAGECVQRRFHDRYLAPEPHGETDALLEEIGGRIVDMDLRLFHGTRTPWRGEILSHGLMPIDFLSWTSRALSELRRHVEMTDQVHAWILAACADRRRQSHREGISLTTSRQEIRSGGFDELLGHFGGEFFRNLISDLAPELLPSLREIGEPLIVTVRLPIRQIGVADREAIAAMILSRILNDSFDDVLLRYRSFDHHHFSQIPPDRVESICEPSVMISGTLSAGNGPPDLRAAARRGG